jgi:hypothetical protein
MGGGSMDKRLDSIVVKRLVRNLRYRQTYIEVFQAFLKPEPHPEVVRLLHALSRVQQSAIVLLSGYLQDLGVPVQDLSLVQKLLGHASSRTGVRSRLRFVHYGLTKAVSWYREQLMDQQMIADPELKRLLFELGEGEAAGLWRTEAVMAASGMGRDPKSKEQAGTPVPDPARGVRRRPWQPGSPGRPVWSGAGPAIKSRKQRASAKG